MSPHCGSADSNAAIPPGQIGHPKEDYHHIHHLCSHPHSLSLTLPPGATHPCIPLLPTATVSTSPVNMTPLIVTPPDTTLHNMGPHIPSVTLQSPTPSQRPEQPCAQPIHYAELPANDSPSRTHAGLTLVTRLMTGLMGPMIRASPLVMLRQVKVRDFL